MKPGVGRDRRAGARQAGTECRWLTGARLRTGRDVNVIDLSSGGALVETTARLLPGASVELQLAAHGWRGSAQARVLRCEVCAVVAGGIRYRAALGFEVRLHVPVFDQARQHASFTLPAGPEGEPAQTVGVGNNYPSAGAVVSLWEAATRARRDVPPGARPSKSG